MLCRRFKGQQDAHRAHVSPQLHPLSSHTFPQLNLHPVCLLTSFTIIICAPPLITIFTLFPFNHLLSPLHTIPLHPPSHTHQLPSLLPYHITPFTITHAHHHSLSFTLSSSTTVTNNSLRNNNIGDPGVLQLSDVLKVNKTLTWLE